MAKLSVNVDHVATIREARKAKEPDPVTAALIAESAGADGITIHLRGDRRHIQDRDVKILRQVVKTPLHLEMAATKEMIKIAQDVKPDMVTLVPERKEEISTEGGLDVEKNFDIIKKTVTQLQEGGIKVSLFVNPDIDKAEIWADTQANFIEINTDSYTEAKTPDIVKKESERIKNLVEVAYELNLGINAGHGLNYRNISALAKIEKIHEFSIGHAIVARAVVVGFERAVREMVELVKNPK